MNESGTEALAVEVKNSGAVGYEDPQEWKLSELRGLEVECLWGMSDKEEFRMAPMFLTWATGGAISQEELLGKRWCI